MNDVNAPERLSSLLWRTARAASRAYRARLAEMDLTARQAAALLALAETPGVGLGALAETLGSDQATASAVIDRLLAADLVRRETDPQDRRRARLYPTDRAMQKVERLEAARRANESLIEEALGPQDGARLRKLLTRLSSELEQAAITGIGARQA